VVGRQNADIADTLHLRDVAMATMFWLSIYGVHIGATEPSMCSGDAALRQITLTTCCSLGSHIVSVMLIQAVHCNWWTVVKQQSNSRNWGQFDFC